MGTLRSRELLAVAVATYSLLSVRAQRAFPGGWRPLTHADSNHDTSLAVNLADVSLETFTTRVISSLTFSQSKEEQRLRLSSQLMQQSRFSEAKAILAQLAQYSAASQPEVHSQAEVLRWRMGLRRVGQVELGQWLHGQQHVEQTLGSTATSPEEPKLVGAFSSTLAGVLTLLGFLVKLLFGFKVKVYVRSACQEKMGFKFDSGFQKSVQSSHVLVSDLVACTNDKDLVLAARPQDETFEGMIQIVAGPARDAIVNFKDESELILRESAPCLDSGVPSSRCRPEISCMEYGNSDPDFETSIPPGDSIKKLDSKAQQPMMARTSMRYSTTELEFIESVDKTDQGLMLQILAISEEAFMESHDSARLKKSEHIAVLLLGGMVVCYTSYVVRRDTRSLSVSTLAVAQSERRRGLGRIMIRRMVQIAKRRSRGEMPLEVVCLSALCTSVDFYKACAFRVQDVAKNESHDAIEGQVYMEYRLPRRHKK